MVHYASPPILIENLIDDIDAVATLFARNAPYMPLGGWFRPDHDGGEAMSPMWFQKDWARAGLVVDGAELFLTNERVLSAAREFYGAEVIVPHTLYVNLMAAMVECGPAHTDNPSFRGRDRSNTPMMLLRSMFWSGLFDRWSIQQATSIWWMNDVDGGGLTFWPEGPDRPPQRHVGTMTNSALVGDNHGMFHQVEPVGPFEAGTHLVSASAELAPASDGGDDWVVTCRGEESYRAPFNNFRASVLLKADVYASDDERRRVEGDLLSLEEVVRIYNDDLADRGEELRVDLDRLNDPALPGELAVVYPEPVPMGAGVSIFDVHR